MSTTIDDRVVEMRFDNQHFEKNVHTSLSTLDKLKQKLNLSGAAKGLENVNHAAKKVNLSGISSAAETVGLKFNAMYTMADQALRNITNSAVNAGKRMVSALTIDPVKTGFSEYETKINSIQTIMSNTASKGTTMADVTRVIDELNTYADKTIYNFAEMTRNIGTFTAAGVGLEESAAAIKGIANLAAASGSSSQQASTAMYQLSQALATGTVKLMDWNSVVNAGMGGEKFQEALKATAREHGVAVDAIIEKNGSFRDSLHEEWLSAEILNETLNKFTVDGAKAYADSMVKAGKYTKEQADALVKEAQAMEDAATKVKTFTQLWDTLKESAQSGWGKTWELIFGDFEEARDLFSELSSFLGGFIDKMSDARNNLIEGALDLASPWTKIMEKLEGSGLGKIKEVADSVGKAADKLEYFQNVVDGVWRGDYKNSDTGRYELLKAAGYDDKVVQDLVNKGQGYKLTVEDVEESHKKFGLTMKTTTEETKKLTNSLDELSEKQLREAGLTEDEIKLYQDLQKEAKRTGKSVSELADEMSKNDGRTLLIESFKNAGSGLVGIFKALGQAWREIFPPMSVVQLYNIIKAINQFSENLRLTDKKTGELTDTAKKLQRTFKGVFALVDIITTILGGGFKIAIKAIGQLLGVMDLDILDVTAAMGDALVEFRDWIDASLDFTKAFEVIVPYIKEAAKAVSKWIDGLKEADNIPEYIVSGLAKGLTAGVKTVVDVVIKLGKTILDTIKKVLRIESPSREFMEIGKYCIEGFISGLQNGASSLWNTIKNIGLKCIETIKKIDIGDVIALSLATGIILAVKKISDVLGMFGAPLEGLGNMLNGIGEMFEGFGANFKAKALKKKSQALLNMAIAIGILAASVALLAQFKATDLLKATAALAALAGIMVALAVASNSLGKINGIGKQSLSLVAFAAAMLIMTKALSELSGLDYKKLPTIIASLVVMVGGIAGILAVFGKFVKDDQAAHMGKAGKMFTKLAIALLIMVGVIKLMSMLKGEEIFKGLAVISALGVFTATLVAVSYLAGEHAAKAGSMLLKISVALLIIVGVIKLISMLKGGEIAKGLFVITAIGAVFAALIAVSYLAGTNASKVGGMLLMVSGALAITVGIIKQISKLEDDAIKKGIGVIAALEILFGWLIAVSLVAGQNAVKAGAMLLLISGAVAILAGVLFIISKMNPDGLDRALGIITVLEVLFGGLIAVSKLAGDNTSTITTLIVAVALMVAALVALSFLDPAELKRTTICLSSVIGVFALLMQATGGLKDSKGMFKKLLPLVLVTGALAEIIMKLSDLDAKNAIKTTAGLSILLTSFATSLLILSKVDNYASISTKSLLIMTGVVTLLAGVLGVMSKLKVGASIQTAAAISLLLNAMAAALVVVSKANSITAGANVKPLLLMGAVVAELAIVLGLMSGLKVEGSVKTATAISILLASMAGVLVVLSTFGAASSAAYPAIGALALLGLVVGELGLILGLLDKFNFDISIGTVTSLSLLIGALSLALIPLTLVGAAAPAAMAGVAALAVLITGMGSLITAIGYLTTEFPKLEEFLNTGIPILEKIGGALGSFFGNIAGGFLEGISTSFPEIGNNLSSFMTNLQPFMDGVSSIKPEAMEGVKMLAETILILTAAEIMDRIVSFMGGDGTSLVTFGQQLVPFGQSLVDFSSVVAGNINEDSVLAAANAGKIMAEMAKTLPGTGGVIQWFMGEKDMVAFGKQLVPFGEAILEFSSVVSSGEINETAVKAASNAGTMMAEMTKTLPSTGGVFQWFMGEKDLYTFGTNLVIFGKYLVQFSNSVSGANIDEKAVKAASNAGIMMAEMAKTLPSTGGVFQWFMGEKDLYTFGVNLATFGRYLVQFSKTVSGGNIDEKAVKAATSCGQMLANLANSLPKDGGIWSLFNGDGIDDFGKKLVTFGKKMASYYKQIKSIDASKLKQSTESFQILANVAKGIQGVNFDKLGSFGKALKNLAKDGIKEFSGAFRDAEQTITTCGKNMITAFTKGITSKKKDMTSAFEGVIKSTVQTTVNARTDFYTAGSQLVAGFTSGISENTWRASAQAAAMAKAAKEAAEAELGIQSPSRVFYEIGSYTGQGFVNALGDYGHKSFNAASNMADLAREGFSKAVSKIESIINSDIDSQPTIRPVIDLSDVRAGVDTINGMMNIGSSVGVLTNVGVISSMMNRRNQNGDSHEVVSAIDNLRKDLGNVGNTNYNIDGITYSGDSEIADAVKALVRAAKMERRT